MDSGEGDIAEQQRVTRTVVTRTFQSTTDTADDRIDASGRLLSSDVGGGVGAGATVTTGDVFDLSSTIVSDIRTSSTVSGTAGGIDRDLSSFKKRIDVNTEEQREHAALMAGLQRKVEEYRRRIADIENQISSGQRTEERLSFNIKEMMVGDEWRTPETMVVSGGGAGAEYELSARLEEERRRNDELRMQLAQVQAEMQRLHQQYEMAIQDKDRLSANRERNLAQYLSEEQKKMMDLWAELQQVRRQFAEYRDQTARELENQRNEFARVTHHVGGVVRRLSITNIAEGAPGADTELAEAIRRFSEQQTLPAGTSVDDYNALMKKYEESIERIVELESRGDVGVGKLSAMEAELKRTKDKLAECQEALRKIHDVSKESEKIDTTTMRSTRSLSPGGVHVVPSEVVRSVRQVIRARDNDVQQLMRKLKNAELEITELSGRFDTTDEARKRLEKQLADTKRELATQQKSIEDAGREVRRLEDRLRASEQERVAVDGVRSKLEEEIRRLKQVIDETVANGERKALEEAEHQRQIVEDEYKSRVADLLRKIDTIQDDNKRLKGDVSGLKDKYRNLEIEYNTTLRRIDEKDGTIRNLEDLKGDLMKDLENHRARFDAMTAEFDSLRTHYDTTSKNTVLIEMTVKELKQQRDDIVKQKDELARQLADITQRMELEMKKRDEVEKEAMRHLGEIEKLKNELSESEKQLMALRRHNDELDTQLKTSQAKMSTLETSLTATQKEVAKMNEINAKLQREKEEILDGKQKAESTIDQLKERIRKLELELEKLRLENRELTDAEQRAIDSVKEHINKAHSLEVQLNEARVEIDELKRRLGQMDDANKERLEMVLRTKAAPEVDTYETTTTTTITETRVKEMADKHRMDVEKLEGDRDELLHRIRILEDELAERQRLVDRQREENDAVRRQYEEEIDRLKAEIANLENKYQNELDDERDQHQREIESLRAIEEDLRDKLNALEKKLADSLDREQLLQKEVHEWEQKCEALNGEVQRLKEQIETIRLDAEKEVQKWKTDLYRVQMECKSLESTNETLKSQLASAQEKIASLNRTINEQAAKARELNGHIRRLEEELADAKGNLATIESDLSRTSERLHTVEEQLSASQLENNKLRGEIDALNRQLDVLKNTNAANESEMERLRKKITQLTAITQEQHTELERLRTERDQLEKADREKAKRLEQLQGLVRTLEAKVDRQRQDLQTLNEKLISMENERNTLRSEVSKLEKELHLLKEHMQRKTDDFNAALEELSNAHRIAEDGRVNALQELETRKFELADLKSRLDNSEQRLATLQNEYLAVDKERDALSDSLRRFQTIVSRAKVLTDGPIDVQNIDVHVQKLLTRIDHLERERDDYRDSLNRMQRKAGESVSVNKHETKLYRSIEERVADVEEGKRMADVKLASAKELLRSQEEALKKRDDERRTMKSKLTAMELETRGKDAQIRHLNELIRTLQADLQNTQNDNRALRERDEKWETVRLQTKLRERDDGGEQRINLLKTQFEAEREKLNETVKKLSNELQQSDAKKADLKDDVERLKRDLANAERMEVELRRNLEEQTRLAREGQHLRDQLVMAQSDLANANNRKQQLENELMNVRSELREQKQRHSDAMNRINDLERQLQNATSDRNRLNDRLNELEKTIATQRSVESDLKRQLSNAMVERKSLQSELDELRRKLQTYEMERSGARSKVEELTRIRITLIKRIEILETEKRSAEALINETAAQREAIERSLNALERENKELSRNCAHLQQQIVQLEMDSGNRLVAITNKQKEEHDRFVQSVKAEKVQVERIVENRDRAQKARIKQLEMLVNQLREQLNAERLRRRDGGDATMRITNGNISSVGIIPASTMLYPQTSSLDYVIGNRNTFSTYYTVPSTYSSPGADIYGDMYKTSSASISLRETLPVDMETARETYTSSYHHTTSGRSDGVVAAATTLGSLEPSTEATDSEVSKKTTVIVHTKRTE